jgi:hypothetical protein
MNPRIAIVAGYCSAGEGAQRTADKGTVATIHRMANQRTGAPADHRADHRIFSVNAIGR